MENRETVSAISTEPRRYVGKKETLAYVLNDVAASLNIDDYKERYIYDVIKIDFNYLAIQNIVATVWDTFNDTFIGVIVEKTRTRWGKFKPYLLLGQFPLTILGLWYWLIPFIFPDTSADYLPKWIFYFAMSIITETANTFTSIARAGYGSTLTPEPLDRSRLIATANLMSHFVEDVPKQIFGIIYDLVINDKVKIKLPKLFAGFGVSFAVLGAFFCLYFFIVSRERVAQTIKKPSVIQGLKAILTNKPMFIQVLSSFLSGFSIGSSRTNFYIDVIGSITWKTIVGIPAFPIKFISYGFVEPLRRRFSTKALWIAGSHIDSVLMLGVYGAGELINIKGKKGYENLAVMIPAFMLRETIWMFFWGIRKVIPEEMRNEAIDYGEWKNGFRTEGMTGVAKGLVTKMVNTVKGIIQPLLFKAFGYDNTKNQGAQTPEARYALFFMCTLLPVVTGILSIIPQLFYDLQGEKKDRMYAELRERRKAIANQVDEYNNEVGENN